MSIKAVFRVQCDGPCKGWLSRTEDAERAWLWPGERAARIAAVNAGWDTPGFSGPVFCPACRLNPLGIELPEPYSVCLTHIAGACDGSTRDCVTQGCRARTPSGAFPCTRPQGHDDEHRNGTLDWF